jgi:hypothetical protein
MRSLLRCLATVVALVSTVSAAEPLLERKGANQPEFQIANETILTSGNELHLTQSRAAVIPGNPAGVLLTTQETERGGAHGYRDLLSAESTDGGRTWTSPARIEALRRAKLPDGYDFVIGDVCPQWHAATGVMLATGKTFGFRDGTKEDRSRERVSYSVYAPESKTWSGLQLLDLADDRDGKPMLEANAGCHQRFDLPDGDVLLPIRYRKNPPNRQYTTIVARCGFDGKKLTYRAHGSELTIPRDRGLYEPSVTGFQGRYFLTMRADHSAFVARSSDELNYEPIVEWTFDDGKVLGSYNTQQHWVTHSDALYLVYTRRGANNDHIMRHRAPLFIARVDPERLCVLRETERILIPESGADLGNFGVVDVSPQETWVITSESIPAERKDVPNRVLLARLVWTQPNQTAAANAVSHPK